MGYELRALVAADTVLDSVSGLPPGAVVRLAQGLSLLALTIELQDHLDESGPRTPEQRAAAWSTAGPVAMVFADYFGGVGEQSATVWDSGRLVLGPLTVGDREPFPADGSPISRALRLLGAQADRGRDEFDTVGLARHRNTEDWTQPPRPIPDEHVVYAAAIRAEEIAVGYVDGWLIGEAARRLAWWRACDLADPTSTIGGLAALRDDVDAFDRMCHDLAAPVGGGERNAIWHYLDLDHRKVHLSREARDSIAAIRDGRQRFLIDRANSGEGMNWSSHSALLGTDRPEEIDAALDRADPLAGVALIGLAMTHPDPGQILPRIAHAYAIGGDQLTQQATVATAHVARLHRTTSPEVLAHVRSRRRGNEADMDLWSFVPHRRLPWWLWCYEVPHVLGTRLHWWWLVLTRRAA